MFDLDPLAAAERIECDFVHGGQIAVALGAALRALPGPRLPTNGGG